ncbi:hypothetical protein AAMO2058_000788100, partial [Amorphochlora amoebiformis]
MHITNLRLSCHFKQFAKILAKGPGAAPLPKRRTHAAQYAIGIPVCRCMRHNR